MTFLAEPVVGIRYMTPAQVSEAIAGFAPAYVNDWDWWLTVPAQRRPAVLGQILRRWQATRPQRMRRTRAEAAHAEPFLEDLFDDAQGSIRVLDDLDLPAINRRTEAQERALRGLWGNFSRLTATGEATCVGITKAILLVTDGRIGPAFDSTVRLRLRLERPKYSLDWLASLDRISDDIAAFESRYGQLKNAVPKKYKHLALGRLYDMALGPKGG